MHCRACTTSCYQMAVTASVAGERYSPVCFCLACSVRACAGAHLPDSFRRSTVQKRRMVLEAWHTEDNANVELVPWRSEKVVTSLVERYRPPRCRKVQEKKRNSCESRYLAFGQGWLKGAQDWLKWWDKDGKFVRKDFRRWLAAEKGGRRLKMKSRRDIAAANKAGWAGLYCRCAENSECGCGACE